jgi:hypothetical protein
MALTAEGRDYRWIARDHLSARMQSLISKAVRGDAALARPIADIGFMANVLFGPSGRERIRNR